MEEEPKINYSEPWFKISTYNDEIYELIEMSKEWVLSVPWSNNKNISKWVMVINWNKIWHYWIKKEYLKYAIIQEVLYPDMINWFWLNSIKKEIETIPENIYEDYLIWRISFFEKMKEYWDNLSNEDLRTFSMLTEDRKKYSQNIWSIIKHLERIWIVKEQEKRMEKSNIDYDKLIKKWKKEYQHDEPARLDKLYEYYRLKVDNLSKNKKSILYILVKAWKALTIKEISDNKVFKNEKQITSKYISATLNWEWMYSTAKDKLFKFKVFEKTEDWKIDISSEDSDFKKWLNLFFQLSKYKKLKNTK